MATNKKSAAQSDGKPKKKHSLLNDSEKEEKRSREKKSHLLNFLEESLKHLVDSENVEKKTLGRSKGFINNVSQKNYQKMATLIIYK